MNNNPEYISLQEATQYCDYSQEYLSLRARQGRLKSVKFGRNWVTKKEWLDEYLERAKEYNNFKTKKFVAPPKNLPIERTESRWSLILRPVPLVRFGFVVALAFVLLVAGIFHSRESFKIVYQELNPTVIEFNENFDFHFTALVSEFNENFNERVTDIIQRLNDSSSIVLVGRAGDAFKEYGQWVTRNTSEWFSFQTEEIVQNYSNANDFVERKISQGYRAIAQFWTPKKIVKEELIPKSGEEGIVVIPFTEEDEEVKKKIKEAFSDEVRVEPEDKTSGIIIPIFKKGEGQKYLYMLVPVSYEQ